MVAFGPRDEVTNYLRSVLFGPKNGQHETVTGTPFLQYMTGMLFPRGEGSVGKASEEVSATADESHDDPEDGDEGGGALNEGMQLAFEALPSAVGLSFRVKDDANIQCELGAAQYLPEPGEKGARGRASSRWKRRAIAQQGPEKIFISKSKLTEAVLGGLGKLSVRWRSLDDGTAIVTVSLVNEQVSKSKHLDPAKTLFQVELSCAPVEGRILPYPEVQSSHGSKSEEAEVEFLYRAATPYARGHGAAADWELDIAGTCVSVRVDFMPKAQVPAATFEVMGDGAGLKCLSVSFLDEAPREEVASSLRTLADGYASWIAAQREAEVELKFKDVADRFVDRASEWLGRVRRGIHLLESEAVAWKCFRLANKAMGMQMVLSRNLKHGYQAIGKKAKSPEMNYSAFRWRPFQIAFMLASVESLLDSKSMDRGTVDVIWFPTGGGKTEAYLFVTAFEMFRRRIVHGEQDTATAVLSRYTLRLLTAQQFQRTSALIVALELIRRTDETSFGTRPFTLGLWVGASLTPNKVRKAHEWFNLMMDSDRPENKFLLEACPHCATELIPSKPRKGRHGWNKLDFGIHSTEADFYFFCPNSECAFHKRLPLQVVDDCLYASPPSMLLGTIDKFAQLTWDDRARVFFGGPSDRSVPPSLIIQDELHLISGPLGSLAAPYEAAIDTIIQLRGLQPKRICATATIRNAGEQIMGLYGRKSAVFPSPCGRWDDAYFFRTEREKPGRQYLGVMGQGYIKPVVAMAWTAAALLQSSEEVKLDPKSHDGYRTLLAYHNSRRELGRTLTAAQDEVATRIQTIASSPTCVRSLGDPLELSAQMVASMTEALGELGRAHTNQRPAVDFVPCTSIISVGVDVDRLGLMMVNGQPKLTSEYIQATSRVGRGEVPGLVVTLFSPSKPRDRSHYEDFRAYHESIYRHVEPTSVTPYALPARERTLHAALVALIRHVLQWRRFDQAGHVDFESAETKLAISTMINTMKSADASEAASLQQLLGDRIEEWKEFAEANAPLHYDSRQAGAQFFSLLYEFGKSSGRSLWPTMTSVRNVDAEVPIVVQ